MEVGEILYLLRLIFHYLLRLIFYYLLIHVPFPFSIYMTSELLSPTFLCISVYSFHPSTTGNFQSEFILVYDYLR